MPAATRPLTTALVAALSPARAAGLGRALGLGRAAAGVTMLTRPRLLPDMLGVDPAASAHLGWALQMLGAREVALGLGSATAASRPLAQAWLLGGLFSDAIDALVVAAAVGSGRVRPVPGAAVVAAAVAAVAVQAAGLGRR